jgi:hypothetical protein
MAVSGPGQERRADRAEVALGGGRLAAPRAGAALDPGHWTAERLE